MLVWSAASLRQGHARRTRALRERHHAGPAAPSPLAVAVTVIVAITLATPLLLLLIVLQQHAG